jgi:uncharacterized membrane protein
MPSFPKGSRLSLALAAAGVAYPFLVYFGIGVASPVVLVLALVGLAGLRLVVKPRGGKGRSIAFVFLAATCGALLLVALSPQAGLKSYPILVSLGLAAWFAHSLRSPPTVIEQLARLREPDLSASAIPYLRNLTAVWLGFFMVNAGISAASAMSGDLALWTLYNGLLSYLLIGALFAGELLLRTFLRARGRGAA